VRNCADTFLMALMSTLIMLAVKCLNLYLTMSTNMQGYHFAGWYLNIIRWVGPLWIICIWIN